MSAHHLNSAHAQPQQTCLHGNHVAQHAKMVDFGGWHMPIHYGSQLDEHHAVRKNCGIFDVSHMCIVDIKGAQAKDFLLFILANSVEKLKVPGKALYSCMLNEKGGVIDDLIVYYYNPHHYRLVINAGCADKDIAWLNQQIQVFDASLQVRKDLGMIALQGPNACTQLQKSIEQLPELFKSFTTDVSDLSKQVLQLNAFASLFSQTNAKIDLDKMVIARTGYTGEDGFEIMANHETIIQLWQQLIGQGVQACGLGSRDTLRLEAGMHLYGQDMNEQTLPINCGLSWTLDLLSDRNFVAKEVLVNAIAHQQLVGLLLKEGGILRAGQIIETANGNGVITSGTYSPTITQSIAMAYVPVGIMVDDLLHVIIRGQKLEVKVVKLPFVRKGKILV